MPKQLTMILKYLKRKEWKAEKMDQMISEILFRDQIVSVYIPLAGLIMSILVALYFTKLH
jgi:hypothetical protein